MSAPKPPPPPLSSLMAQIKEETAAMPITDEQSFRTTCEVDEKEILVMAFKGTGVCGEYCRKVRDGEIVDERS